MKHLDYVIKHGGNVSIASIPDGVCVTVKLNGEYITTNDGETLKNALSNADYNTGLYLTAQTAQQETTK